MVVLFGVDREREGQVPAHLLVVLDGELLRHRTVRTRHLVPEVRSHAAHRDRRVPEELRHVVPQVVRLSRQLFERRLLVPELYILNLIYLKNWLSWDTSLGTDLAFTKFCIRLTLKYEFILNICNYRLCEP